MGRVLGIVYRALAARQVRKAGYSLRTADTGAVTLIQRFGSALNLNIHFHMLLLDGVYVGGRGARLRFQRIKAPDKAELEILVRTISERVGRHLERQGLLVRDQDNSYLAVEPGDDSGLEQLQGSSITYRIALGPHQGRKAFSLQTLPPQEGLEGNSARVAKASGFSLHAGVAAESCERHKLERLCRYITRPALSEKRLSLTTQGRVRYQLKTPYRDGTTHVVLEPLDFIARLAALVPSPRVNLARYHGVFAPNSLLRAQITPGGRGKRIGTRSCAPETENERRTAMHWAQRLKRVFNIDVTRCQACGGTMKVIACIEDPQVIGKILVHLGLSMTLGAVSMRPQSRAPPLWD